MVGCHVQKNANPRVGGNGVKNLCVTDDNTLRYRWPTVAYSLCVRRVLVLIVCLICLLVIAAYLPCIIIITIITGDSGDDGGT